MWFGMSVCDLPVDILAALDTQHLQSIGRLLVGYLGVAFGS